MRHIWIVQTAEPLHCDKDNPRPMRAMNLSNFLEKHGFNVTIWSTVFYHQQKRKRTVGREVSINKCLNIRLISSIGYKKNISIMRIIDHIQLAINFGITLLKYTGRKPDLLFIGFPPIGISFLACLWARAHGIPYILDVKDKWPEIFIRAGVPIPTWVLQVLMCIPSMMARWSMKNANCVSSISPPFLEWINIYSSRSSCSMMDFVFPLAAELPYPKNSELKDSISRFSNLLTSASSDTKIIFFVGNMMRTTFNFDPIVIAASKAIEENKNWAFLLCGDGEAFCELENQTRNYPNVIMPGYITQADLIVFGNRADVAIAPIKNISDYLISYPNKFLDYLNLGLPVITSLNGIVGDLIKKNNLGSVYSENIPLDLYKKLEEHFEDKHMHSTQRKNIKYIWETQFNTKNAMNLCLERINYLLS